MEATIVLECRPYVEGFVSAEVPICLRVRFVVDDGVTDGAYVSGVEVERTVLVLPNRN